MVAEDDPPVGLLEAFSRQAQVSGMQAVQLDNGEGDQGKDDFMATLKVISDFGKVMYKNRLSQLRGGAHRQRL